MGGDIASPVWNYRADFDVSRTSDISVSAYLRTAPVQGPEDMELKIDFKPTRNEPLTIEAFDLLKVIGRGSFGKIMQVRKKDTQRAWDASKILVFQSIGSIFHDFSASKKLHSESLKEAWNVFVNHKQESVLIDHQTIGAPALRFKERVSDVWERVLQSIDAIGEAILRSGTQTPPVQSARLSTRSSASIRYGKVEVRAKIPTGDWMWPAIWMLPRRQRIRRVASKRRNRHHGISRKRHLTPQQGSNYVRGSLNWSPVSWFNAVAKTYGWWTLRRGSYTDDFHTYSIEWTDKFMRLYVDSRLHYMFQMNIKEFFWDLGDFPSTTTNGSETIALQNPVLLDIGPTTCFLRIVKELSNQINALSSDIPYERIEGIWRQVIDVFRGGILVDCSPAEEFPLDVQEAEDHISAIPTP
ncbi:concanavalin A-like lectin/glucanase domain-containing protein [Armillaria luteobubalina]|uniref:Concanavalin A-like lectin/glucanase domain-containing protein n=1 Tax=Armillaria luteobubalina TaxID=153913 RepID=A0AA39UW02_9AGAR|nr:concanavalin A-like lectin/glucanase domain-containing protein [Armillaria luteobubalina]